MHWVDVAIVIIVLGSAVTGLLRGLIVEVGAIIGAVAGLFLARQEYKTAESFLAVFFHRDAHLAMAAYILVFVIVWALITTLAMVLRSVVRFTPLGILDRVGGAVVGLLIGILTVAVLLLLAERTHDRSLEASIHSSTLAPKIEKDIPGVEQLIPTRLPGIPVHSARH